MERMGIEYQRFNGKEYVSLRRYYNLQCKCKAVEEENAELKSELSKFRDSFKKYRDYEKEELAESCYDLARENEKLKNKNKALEIENFVMKDRLKFGYKGVTREEIERVEQENQTLKEEIGKLVMNGK